MKKDRAELSRRAFLTGAATLGAAAVAGGALAGCSNANAKESAAETESAASEADPIPPVDVPESWDKEVDVIVVGTGGGGLSATVYAA